MKSKFAKVPERPDLPAEEERVLEFWKDIDAFKKQLELSKGRKPYTFYDGPPFATGLPHYGHIAAGTIKDIMTRYATQTGHYCQRRFGWDCHGLPIEYEIDKVHEIKSSSQREAMGVEAYNKLCRAIVMKYSGEWEHIVGRFGRWIDFQNDYKTMDCKYMESVWWTFKQIFDKGLVYKGSRIMPFSYKCNTVLSNFEANSNYQDTKDPAVFITFPLADDPEVSLIAWTTTPWTLPSNMAAAVNPEFVYLKIHDEKRDRVFIVAEARIKDVVKQCQMKHKVLEKIKGKDLVGKKYVPLFNYFKERGENGGLAFTIIPGSFVTKDAGTGIVHCAPGFGDEDYNACVAQKIVQAGKAPMPLDDDGCFTDVISDYKGVNFKEADPPIMAELKQRGRLIQAGTIVHSYPFCWRSDTPLIYRAVDTWFIKVTDIKQDLLKKNEDPKWVPAFVQEKRFKNWLEDARDWCFSRNRYWGNPIPIWASDDMQEIVCVGSIQELQELTGCGEITDLHRESVDHLTIPSKQGKGVLRRIPEVFDCWFESGSMPYAQSHYPFSINDEEFMKGFPANFIAEGLDQTRGWFYTLMVISTAVKNSAPFKNLIVNGIVLAEDGTKMSKRKQNYPEPMLVAKSHGADAVRLYLCNSPIVRAETLKFAEKDVEGVVREIFLPWFNAYRFLIQNITRYERETGKSFVFDKNLKFKLNNKDNFTDRWIVSATQTMLKLSREEMEKYHLYNVVKPLLSFLDQLTNWYVRLNRDRMKGEKGNQEAQVSLNILFDVIMSTTLLMASITPFLTEHMYQNLRNGIDPADQDLFQESLHFLQIPDVAAELVDEAVERKMKRMQDVIITGRLLRDRNTLSLKTPLRDLTVVDADEEMLKDCLENQAYILDELNIFSLKTEKKEDQYVEYKCEPDNKLMGQALGKKFSKDLKKKIAAQTNDDLRAFLKNGETTIDGIKIERSWLNVQREFNKKYAESKDFGCATSAVSCVMINTTVDEELKQIRDSREITNRIQKLRKSSGVQLEDDIEVFYELNTEAAADGAWLRRVTDLHGEKIQKSIKRMFMPAQFMQPGAPFIDQTTFEIDSEVVTLYIYKATPHLVRDQAASLGANVETLQALLNSFDITALAAELDAKKGKLTVNVDDKEITLQEGKHFYRDGKSRFAK